MKAVVSSVIDSKTVMVTSTFYKKHPRYGKYMMMHKKYLVDSAKTDPKIGQEVFISPSRPISKRKKWSITAGNK